MELKKLEVTAFADLLASDAPAPGGGSTAALEGALGAALTAMVCGLTVGKAKYAASQELAAETLELTESLLGRFNDSAASDLGVAALSLRSAIQGAWLNVRINISSIKDQDLAERSRERGEALLAKALPAADRIYAAVLDMM